ncbi:hypothetical protein L1049_012611 [Liquidambar formosana]|uniref:Photosynthesis system II assembly factor Ycf48/Hcf136-like domain-containing protein n=1 Tax=Liquidambar formosana TaxID=63359 RepID=A0AAP0N6S1_LIQFO
MEGIIVRRVIPSDNSCLFNAVGYVMDHDKHKASELRQDADVKFKINWKRVAITICISLDLIHDKEDNSKIHVYIKATGEKSAEMVTDEGAIYVTSNRGYNWRAAIQETVSATLNRCSSTGCN